MFRSFLAVFCVVLLGTLPVRAQQESGVNFETRLSSLEEQIRTLTGKTEQVDYAVRRMDQALQRMQADYDARLAKLESAGPVAQNAAAAVAPPVVTAIPAPPKTAAPATVAAGAENEGTDEQLKGSLGALKMQGEKVTGGIKNPKAPPLPETPADYGLTPQEQYDRAFGLLRQASYDDAEKAFKGFIDKNPQDKLLDNAKYWYAETFYVRAKFNEAAVAFADAFQQNPQGTKAPDSLLKLAMSLASLDKAPDACGALAALKGKYPNAPVTIRSRADQERVRLKCK